MNFRGTGVSNAIYVDELVLLDYASYTNHDLNGNLPALGINPDLVIYYGQALTIRRSRRVIVLGGRST